MQSVERRMAPRFILKVPLLFCPSNTSAAREYKTESMNISICGTCFVTDLPVSVGQEVQVVLAMPEGLTGKPAMQSRYTGRVVYVQAKGFPWGRSRVGVHFHYYEVERPEAERSTPQPESLQRRSYEQTMEIRRAGREYPES